MREQKGIYLDYAATTPVDERVLNEMLPFFKTVQGNPSSMHRSGREAKKALEIMRQKVAKILNTKSEEIIFTGSGTESDNLAIIGAAHAYKNIGKHIIVSSIEHKAVLNSAKFLEKEGFEISYTPVNSDGVVDVEELMKLIRPDTILISVMLVNNEVGTIQPIEEISKRISEVRKGRTTPIFHTDACQAPCILEIHPYKLGVDLLTLNGAKIYGPKGAGCLFVRKGVHLEPVIQGGGQEFGLRSGTESIAQIAGFALALELSQSMIADENSRLKSLMKLFREGIQKNISGVTFNTPQKNSIPSILNVSFSQTEGESILLDLDENNIYCSTGSACASADLNPSHVLLAMSVPLELAHSSLRFSLGRMTTEEEIKKAIEVLPKVVERIRSICPKNIN